MPFSSFNFILLLPFLLLAFWSLPPKLQKAWLLVASLIVYMAAGWRDLALLVGAVSVNWVVPRFWGGRHRIAGAMVVLNVAFLACFKYAGFLESLVTGGEAEALVIPLGISFYIFQLIAYQVELARGELEVQPPFWDFLLYIFFFPHHQAGPIMRPHAFLRCFTAPRTFFRSRLVTGLLIFLWGLFKKVWIADLVAPFVDQGFGNLHYFHGGRENLPYLAVLYGIQIYGDFSGYSDMAVGIGRLFGFKFDRNFHQPYLASGASEFWRRWHVTLSKWLRDFIYIPLGGNRGSSTRTLVNLMVVMLLGGLWHGAGWNFVLWGGLHGLLLVGERLLPLPRWPFLKLPRTLLFQALVMLTWLPFRERSPDVIWQAMGRASAWVGPGLKAAVLLFLAVLAFAWVEERLERAFVSISRTALALPFPVLSFAYGVAFWLVLVGGGHATTFIYQRF